MSGTRERYNQYLLEQIAERSENWRWLEDELPQIKRGWEWASQQPDQAVMLRYVWGLQKFFERRGMFQLWLQWAEQTGNVSVVKSDEEAISSMFIHLGFCYWNLGNAEKSLTYYRRAYQLVHDSGDDVVKARILNSMGMVYFQLGNYWRVSPCWQRQASCTGR